MAIRLVFSIFEPSKVKENGSWTRVFLQQILEDRDQLYRETSKLKSQLSSFENFETERVSYQQMIDQKDTTSAKEEIEQYKKVRVIEVKDKKYPVCKPLPESLPREETHIYPEHII